MARFVEERQRAALQTRPGPPIVSRTGSGGVPPLRSPPPVPARDHGPASPPRQHPATARGDIRVSNPSESPRGFVQFTERFLIRIEMSLLVSFVPFLSATSPMEPNRLVRLLERRRRPPRLAASIQLARCLTEASARPRHFQLLRYDDEEKEEDDGFV